jgi:hypothetical protein
MVTVRSSLDRERAHELAPGEALQTVRVGIVEDKRATIHHGNEVGESEDLGVWISRRRYAGEFEELGAVIGPFNVGLSCRPQPTLAPTTTINDGRLQPLSETCSVMDWVLPAVVEYRDYPRVWHSNFGVSDLPEPQNISPTIWNNVRAPAGLLSMAEIYSSHTWRMPCELHQVKCPLSTTLSSFCWDSSTTMMV